MVVLRKLVRSAIVLGVALALMVPAPASAAVLPSGFEDTLLTSFDGAMSLAFTPDGRMLIAGRTGELRVYQNGSLSPPALNLRSKLCWDHERGMVGIAVDPEFATNHHIYLYYTFDKHHTAAAGVCDVENSRTPVNRLSRFTLGANNVVDPASETILLDDIPSYGGNHNAGDLGFGKDGYLYVSVGDGGCDYLGNSGCGGANDASRDQNVLLGKILRITPAAGSRRTTRSRERAARAATSPVGPTPARSARRPTPGASATRSASPSIPTRRARASSSTTWADLVWEEIDLGTAGADYGWNLREGHCAARPRPTAVRRPPG